ncbi:MAG: DUF6377 domain-containing protein [Phocaeicola dorei]|nr:DUF6377 domain-containing protein [Phocaeicola dorei]
MGIHEDRKDWQQEAQLLIIYIYVMTNQQIVAEELLKNFAPIEQVHEAIRPQYAKIYMDQKLRIYNQMKHTPFEAQYKDELQQVWEIYKSYLSSHSNEYFYMNYLINADDNKEWINDLKKILEKEPEDSSDRPMLEYIMGLELQKRGDSAGYIHYIIQAARHDIRSAHRESSALSILMEIVSKQNDVKRAFEYAMFCNENARIYKDTGRSLNLLKAQSIIQQGYKKSIENYINYIWLALIGVTLLCFIVFFLFLKIRTKDRKQRNSYKEIDSINKQIQTVNKQLQEQIKQGQDMTQEIEQKHTLLQQEVRKRESYFVDIFYPCSNYIHELTNFRKKINNMLKNGMLNEAKRLSSTSILSDDELEKLHKQFDRIFISTHSDFVERFNELLRPEEQISVKDNETLTPELRIYALVCLGITDSTKIADFLHYSPQTIYNYRYKIRHAARILDKEFVDAVKELYTDDVATRTEKQIEFLKQ